MIIACTEAKDASLAEHMLSWAQANGKCTLPVFAAATKVLAAAKQFGQICSIYEVAAADGLVLDDAAYGQLIKFAVQVGRVGLARSLFQKAKNPDMLNYMSLIRACGQEKNVPQALELLREMREAGAVDTAAYNCVLDVCVICNNDEAAKEVFEEMKQASHVDVISYNTLLKLYVGEGGSWAKVESLLEEMRLCGIKPNIATYNSLLGTALSAGDLRKAWQIVDLMESSGLGVMRTHAASFSRVSALKGRLWMRTVSTAHLT
jgi:pentatricopeptide repeat protein